MSTLPSDESEKQEEATHATQRVCCAWGNNTATAGGKTRNESTRRGNSTRREPTRDPDRERFHGIHRHHISNVHHTPLTVLVAWPPNESPQNSSTWNSFDNNSLIISKQADLFASIATSNCKRQTDLPTPKRNDDETSSTRVGPRGRGTPELRRVHGRHIVHLRQADGHAAAPRVRRDVRRVRRDVRRGRADHGHPPRPHGRRRRGYGGVDARRAARELLGRGRRGRPPVSAEPARLQVQEGGGRRQEEEGTEAHRWDRESHRRARQGGPRRGRPQQAQGEDHRVPLRHHQVLRCHVRLGLRTGRPPPAFQHRRRRQLRLPRQGGGGHGALLPRVRLAR